MAADRVILHCDCNSFFASVETLDRPELANVPMAVAGDPENRHGIILAKNELAKKTGVVTAETIWSARQKCPGLVCVPPHMSRYHEISKRINAIYLTYTDLVEPFSVDESYLDVTGSLSLFGMTPRQMADEIRKRVHREIGITISVGVSFCKVFAKLGSDFKKPDATTVFDREAIRERVYPMPVSSMLFVGKRTAEQLEHMGISTIGMLAGTDEEVLRRTFGEMGTTLSKYARGLDDDPVKPFGTHREVKSISNGTTFRRDLRTVSEMRAGITMLCDEIAARLREKDKRCTVVQVTIRDPEFRTIQRQRKLDTPTWLRGELIDVAASLVTENWKSGTQIRMLTVAATGLVPSDLSVQQLTIFDAPQQNEKNEKQEKLEKAMTDIRQKIGTDSIYRGVYDERSLGLTNRKSKRGEGGKNEET